MTIHLPNDLESSIQTAVHNGRFASVDDAMAEAARLLLRELARVPQPDQTSGTPANAGLSFIGALRDDAELLDQAVEHAMKVRESAELLFTSLKSVHRLAPEYREWLSAAAMLYEVGLFVNRTGRHRHTYYIISNSEILGYTPEQRRIIAAIARYLGRSRPMPEDGPMAALPPGNYDAVRKAGLLLRLARALNLGRGTAVKTLGVSVRSAQVRFKLERGRHMGVELEVWAIEKDSAYFREVFGRELSVAAV